MSDDFVTPAELHILLASHKSSEPDQPVSIPESMTQKEAISDQLLISKLQEHMVELTRRVSEMEHQLIQEITARSEWSAEQRAIRISEQQAAETAVTPEPGSFSRMKSYGKLRKKKKSVWKKLFE